MSDYDFRHLRRRHQQGQLSDVDYIRALEHQLLRLGVVSNENTSHNWISRNAAAQTAEIGELTLSPQNQGEWWCQHCGTIKQGPHAEHGAYWYFTYYIPGPPRHPRDDSASWFEKLGFSYYEDRNDPSCPMIGTP